MSTSLRLGVCVALVVGAAIGYFALREGPAVDSADDSRIVNNLPLEDQHRETVAPSPVQPADAAKDAIVRTSDAAAFAASTDYFDFAKSMLDRAKSGDATAQYQLYAALAYCEETYRAFFLKAKGPPRTLDEALQRVSTQPSESIDVVRTAFTRCSQLYNESSKKEFGPPLDWLRLATEQGQPLALATTAEMMLLTPELQSSATNADAATSSALPDAMAMFLRALKSKDPEVIWKIGGMQELLDGTDEDRRLKQWAWWLAACQRGYDCEHSRWMEFSCRFDHMCAQDMNATDFIRRSTGLDFPEIEKRAKEINASIDSESWDSLGLVVPSS